MGKGGQFFIFRGFFLLDNHSVILYHQIVEHDFI